MAATKKTASKPEQPEAAKTVRIGDTVKVVVGKDRTVPGFGTKQTTITVDRLALTRIKDGDLIVK